MVPCTLPVLDQKKYANTCTLPVLDGVFRKYLASVLEYLTGTLFYYFALIIVKHLMFLARSKHSQLTLLTLTGGKRYCVQVIRTFACAER